MYARRTMSVYMIFRVGGRGGLHRLQVRSSLARLFSFLLTLLTSNWNGWLQYRYWFRNVQLVSSSCMYTVYIHFAAIQQRQTITRTRTYIYNVSRSQRISLIFRSPFGAAVFGHFLIWFTVFVPVSSHFLFGYFGNFLLFFFFLFSFFFLFTGLLFYFLREPSLLEQTPTVPLHLFVCDFFLFLFCGEWWRISFFFSPSFPNIFFFFYISKDCPEMRVRFYL